MPRKIKKTSLKAVLPMAIAVTGAVRKAGESLKSELRAQVVGAGLGRLANVVPCNWTCRRFVPLL